MRMLTAKARKTLTARTFSPQLTMAVTESPS